MDNPTLPRKVLIVDDDPTVVESIDNYMKKHGVQSYRAIDLETAIYQFNQQLFEVVIVELEFAHLPGLALIQKFRQNAQKERAQVGVVLTSGQNRKATDDGLASELGEIEFVNKPCTDVKLVPAVTRALQRRRAHGEYDQIRTICYDHLKKDGGIDDAIAHVKANLPKLQLKGMALMASLYEEAGLYLEALKVVDAILSKKADDIAMNNSKGRLLLKSGDAVSAREFLEKADKAAPKNLDRLKAMAAMYLKLEEPNASLGKMRELIHLSPGDEDLKFDLFKDLETAGYLDHAVALCKETTLPNEVVRYYNNKGVSWSKSGENTRAVHEYESALKFFPNFRQNYRILFNIAIAEANQKTPENFKRAEMALERCLELHPTFDKAKTLLVYVKAALRGFGAKAG